jgi:hypothetical protein
MTLLIRYLLIIPPEKCLTFNEEPAHWKIVLSLHKYSYSLPNPFVIPPNASVPEDQHLNEQAADSTKLRPLTPSSGSSTRTTPVSSPSKSSCSLKVRFTDRLHFFHLSVNRGRRAVSSQASPPITPSLTRTHREYFQDIHQTLYGQRSTPGSASIRR